MGNYKITVDGYNIGVFPLSSAEAAAMETDPAIRVEKISNSN